MTYAKACEIMSPQQAIDRSIHTDSIVTIDYDEDALDILLGWSDGSVDANGVTELWGTEDGSEWRVHVRDPQD